MPRKRRKLSKELENEIANAKKKVELIMAQINDIQEEDIQSDYRLAFEPAAKEYIYLSDLYNKTGLTPESEKSLSNYKIFLQNFENEYEI